MVAAPLPRENTGVNVICRRHASFGVRPQNQQITSISCVLTCHDCLNTTSGASPCTVGGVNVTVVSCRGSQAVHLSTQGCESLVVFLWGETEEFFHKQDVAVRSYYTGPLKPYRCTRNSFGKSDLRSGRHCGGGRSRMNRYLK